MKYEISVRMEDREVDILAELASLGFTIFQNSELTQELRSVDNINVHILDFNNDTLRIYKCVYNGEDDDAAEAIMSLVIASRHKYKSLKIWCEQ